jgi:hypothetical protein
VVLGTKKFQVEGLSLWLMALITILAAYSLTCFTGTGYSWYGANIPVSTIGQK